MSDPFADWSAQAAAEAAEAAKLDEQRRQAMAQLLVAREQDQAAGVVLIARFERVQVDNWDGGQFEAHLAVPAWRFDLVTDDVRQQIDAAAAAVIGPSCYQGLQVGVRLEEAVPEWDRELFERLLSRQPPASGPIAALS